MGNSSFKLEEAVDAAVQRTVERLSPSSPWLTTEQAAAYLKSTPGTLETWRKKGRGPAYHGGHRFTRYHVGDLDAWMRGEANR